MKKHTIEMELVKECVGSNRYEAKGQHVHTVYIQKTALERGETAPSKIVLTVQEVD